MFKQIRTKARYMLFLLLALMPVCASSDQRKIESESRQEVVREIQYGKLLSQKIFSTYSRYNNDDINLYVNKVGKSVALYAGRPEIEYYFSVLDTDNVNAYAAPGGYIFVTKGALSKMDDESELAAVLAHEIAHVNLKHIMKELPPPRSSGFANFISSILVAQGTVVSSSMSEVVNKAAETLFVSGIKRESELEADTTSISYIIATGYNTNGLIDFLKRIDSFHKENSNTSVYNAHPATEERLNNLLNYFSKNNISESGQKARERFKEMTKNL